MRNKLKVSAILLIYLFLLILLPSTAANAMTFEMSIPSFGLYCENENAIVHGKVKYVVGENGKAVANSQYSVNSGTFYIPFISSAFNIPEIDTNLNTELCYGVNIRLSNDYKYDFYSADLNGMIGTVYTLNATDETFTVDFTMLENQNCICRFTQGFRMIRDSKHIKSTINGAQTEFPYEVFILNGDCSEFESSADITKETVTVKEYIDRNFNEFKDYYSIGGDFTPDLFYALANQAVTNNINYDFSDFFIDSFAQMRLNAYKIVTQTPCVISYSMTADVQKNSTFSPEIYKAEQTASGNYKVDYSIELNGNFPYIIESSTNLQKQDNGVYTADNVDEDFYFVFSSSKKPKSITDNNKTETWRIILFVVAGIGICVLIALIIYYIVLRIKAKK